MKNDKPEYIYRFPLNRRAGMKKHGDPLVDLFSEQIRNLLEICMFTYNGIEVTVDGFQFGNDRMHNHSIYPKQSAK